ncbi:MAG: MFS transporter, partial [Acidimicrobiia bacterium]
MRRLAAPISFLFAARLVLNTGYRLVYPFLPVISRGLGISVDQGGLLVAARNLAGTATPAVIAGVRPGRNSRRLIVVALALFALGAAITSATGFFWGALVGFVLMGMGKPAFDVGAMSYLADRTPYERRARILSVLELTWAGGLLVGAPAVGWLIARNGWEAPFWVISGLAGLAVLASFRLLSGASGEEETGEKNPLIDRSGRVLLLVFILFSTAAELIFVALGSWLELEFDLSIIALGGFAAFLGISELTGEFTTLALADRFG